MSNSGDSLVNSTKAVFFCPQFPLFVITRLAITDLLVDASDHHSRCINSSRNCTRENCMQYKSKRSVCAVHCLQCFIYAFNSNGLGEVCCDCKTYEVQSFGEKRKDKEVFRNSLDNSCHSLRVGNDITSHRSSS